MKTPLTVILEKKKIPVVTVSASMTAFEAVGVMNEKKISTVLIVEEDNLVGIFTERDVLRRVVGASLDPKATVLRDVMSSGLTTITVESTIDETMTLMTEKHCRHLPVLQDGQLVGVISVGDVSRWLSALCRAEAENLKEYIGGGYSG